MDGGRERGRSGIIAALVEPGVSQTRGKRPNQQDQRHNGHLFNVRDLLRTIDRFAERTPAVEATRRPARTGDRSTV